MALQIKFFIIPIRGIQETEIEINRFLRSVRVVNIEREFVVLGENSFWGMAVEYLTGDGQGSNVEGGQSRKSRIDYKEVLSPQTFALFVKLREWRKQIAAEQAVPVYTVFTNEQLAQIAEKKAATRVDLQQIEGIGEARIKKYGDAVIAIVTQ